MLALIRWQSLPKALFYLYIPLSQVVIKARLVISYNEDLSFWSQAFLRV